MSRVPGNRRRVLTFGEALIDEFPGQRVVAGAPLHIAAHLATLGWSASLITRVGDDPDGRHIIEVLREHDVDPSFVEVDGQLPTGRSTIELTDQGHDFTVHRPAAWDAIAGPDPIPKHDVTVFGTLPCHDPRSRTALSRLLDAGSFIVADANLRPPDFDDAAIRLIVERADLLKVNEEELAAITAMLGVEREGLHSLGPQWVCVTRGPDGADLTHRDGRVWATSGTRQRVVDTVGAGDAFCAGLIDGLMAGGDPRVALEQARELAEATVRHRGGLPVR